MAITRGQLTVIGPESAVELLFQYSVNGSSNWHTVFAEGDLYFRVSSDDGVSWSEPARFAGPSGVSTYVHLAYANSADGSVGFSTSISTGKTYLGQWVNSSSTPSQTYGDYKWQKFVGEDGKGIVSATVRYQLHTSGTTPPTGTWLTDPPTPIEGRYSWTRTITTYTSGDPVTTYSVAYLATNGQNGADGKGITSTVIEYAQTLSGTTIPSSWSTTRPGPIKGQYLWTKTTISYSDSTNSVSYNISYSATDGQKGDKGDKGDPGIEGAPGANGQSQWTHLRYSVASNGNPMVKDPTATTKYIGIAVTNSGTAPTGYASYTWQKFVGEDGDDGDDGKGISSTIITYANHTNGTTAPTTGWQATPAPVKGQYLWTRTITTYTDGSTIPTYSVAYQATDGQAGKGISLTVVEYAQTASGTTTPTAWSGTRPAPIKGQYLWSKTTITYTDTTTSVSYNTSYSATDGQKGDPGAQGIPGDDGEDGQQYWTWIKYADSPTTGMNDLPAGKAYIGIAHNKTSPTETSVYADYTWSLIKGDKGDRGATGEQGPRGENGTSVTGIVENYLATPLATGVTKATSGWTTTMQPMTTTNKYLWNYETIQFSAGDPQDTIPVIVGVYGDTGRALTSITEYYLASASSTGVTRPATDGTSGWTTTPQVTTPSLPYLWNYEKLTWNAAPTTSYINPIVIAIHGAKGDKGDQGVQGIQGTTGAAGQSQWTHLRYSTAANGNPFVPTPTAATKYIGIAVTATSTAPTGYASYTWQKFVGDNGGQGIQGPAGTNGQPTYTWIRYADNASGAGIVDTPAGKDYIGIAHNKLTATESNTPGDYTWSLIKGAPGRSITAVDVHYAKNDSTTTAPTTGWSTTAPAWENGKYIWSKTVTTYSTGLPTESTPVCITGQAGGTGAVGRGVSSIVEQFYLSTSKTTQEGGNWSTTMPVWENGKYVWTRSLITYTSGVPATSTTEPLVSSEWEAVNEIEIGGTNLVPHSMEFKKGSAAVGLNSSITSEGYLRIIADAGNSGYVNAFHGLRTNLTKIESAFNEGDKFTISFVVKSEDATLPPTIYIKPGMGYYQMVGTILPEFSTVSYTGNWKKLDDISLHLGFTGKVGTYIFKAWKIEKGDKATNWSPAPGDIYENLSTPNSTVISGNNITTGTVDADRVNVINLDASNIISGTIDAGEIDVINLDASNITAGTIDAEIIDVINLDASNITAGTIDAEIIDVINLDASDITTGTLNASQVNVINLDASNITTGTLNADRITIGAGTRFDDGYDPIKAKADGSNLLEGTTDEWAGMGAYGNAVLYTLDRPYRMVDGEPVTFSLIAIVYGTVPPNPMNGIYLGVPGIRFLDESDELISSHYSSEIPVNAESNPGAEHSRFVTAEVPTGTSHIELVMSPNNDLANWSLKYKQLKLEYGSAATPWKPTELLVNDVYVDGQRVYHEGNLAIGGRNYILNSAILSVSGLGGGASYEYRLMNVGQSYMNIPSGTTVTISFDLTMEIQSAGAILNVYNSNHHGPMMIDYRSLSIKGDVGTTVKGRYSVVTNISQRPSPTQSTNAIEFYSIYGTSNFYKIQNVKLEVGNQPTDWTPAPEDLAIAGTTTISGSNITTGTIKSANGYSQINLSDGSFNFASGGFTYSPSAGALLAGWKINSTSMSKSNTGVMDKYVVLDYVRTWRSNLGLETLTASELAFLDWNGNGVTDIADQVALRFMTVTPERAGAPANPQVPVTFQLSINPSDAKKFIEARAIFGGSRADSFTLIKPGEVHTQSLRSASLDVGIIYRRAEGVDKPIVFASDTDFMSKATFESIFARNIQPKDGNSIYLHGNVIVNDSLKADIAVADTRDLAYHPDYFSGNRISTFFNNTYGHTWLSGITVAGWNTGYQVWQLGAPSSNSFDEALKFRVGKDNTWGSWRYVSLVDPAGDLNARLFRSSYQYEGGMSGGLAFRNSTTDNYIRFCNSPAAIRTWLGATTEPTTHGSGNNISYRFPNGLQISVINVVHNAQNISAAWGTLYESGTKIGPKYSVAFNAEPVVTISVQGSVHGFISSGGGNATTSPEYAILRPTAINGGNYRVKIIAIGRWK